MRLNFQVLHREGDMRYSLVRVRENAESIAFYDGHRQEKSNTASKFDRIFDTRIRKIKWAAGKAIRFPPPSCLSGLELWRNVYNFATILIPTVLTAPRFFAGEVEFGVIAQASYAFDRMNDALSAFVANFDSLSSLSAQTERLITLMDTMKRIEEENTNSLRDKSKIEHSRVQPPIVLRMEQLHFKTPGGEQLIASSQDLILHEGRTNPSKRHEMPF